MTNELGTTLQDIEAKAERKREAIEALNRMASYIIDDFDNAYDVPETETIRKYIEEN